MYRKDDRKFSANEALITSIIIFINVNFFNIIDLIHFPEFLSLRSSGQFLRNYSEFYIQLLTKIRSVSINNVGVLSFLAYFLIADLCYYIIHLSFHKINFLWASHYCHHTISKFNLINGHRDLFKIVIPKEFLVIYFIPVSLGFNLGGVLQIVSLISLYNVFLHNTFIPRLKYIEYLFNTPALHRMHHSISNKSNQLNINYGGVLIIWDRVFGTYAAETEVNHIYGVEEFYGGNNFFLVLFTGWIILFKKIKSENAYLRKLKLLFWY